MLLVLKIIDLSVDKMRRNWKRRWRLRLLGLIFGPGMNRDFDFGFWFLEHRRLSHGSGWKRGTWGCLFRAFSCLLCLVDSTYIVARWFAKSAPMYLQPVHEIDPSHVTSGSLTKAQLVDWTDLAGEAGVGQSNAVACPARRTIWFWRNSRDVGCHSLG